jgi:hypothetical protein
VNRIYNAKDIEYSNKSDIYAHLDVTPRSFFLQKMPSSASLHLSSTHGTGEGVVRRRGGGAGGGHRVLGATHTKWGGRAGGRAGHGREVGRPHTGGGREERGERGHVERGDKGGGWRRGGVGRGGAATKQ